MVSVHWSVGFILFYSSSCITIKFDLLDLLRSPIRDWPVQFLLPPEPSSASPCICSSSGTGKGFRIQLLGWGERSHHHSGVCGHTALPSICLDMFFVHLYHVSMKTVENPETSHWSRMNCHHSEHWLVSVWSLALVQMTKGCLQGEDTYFYRGIEHCSNVIYTKQLKIFLKSFLKKLGIIYRKNIQQSKPKWWTNYKGDSLF